MGSNPTGLLGSLPHCFVGVASISTAKLYCAPKRALSSPKSGKVPARRSALRHSHAVNRLQLPHIVNRPRFIRRTVHAARRAAQSQSDAGQRSPIVYIQSGVAVPNREDSQPRRTTLLSANQSKSPRRNQRHKRRRRISMIPATAAQPPAAPRRHSPESRASQ